MHSSSIADGKTHYELLTKSRTLQPICLRVLSAKESSLDPEGQIDSRLQQRYLALNLTHVPYEVNTTKYRREDIEDGPDRGHILTAK